MKKELFEFVVLLVTMIKMKNSQPQWLPTKEDFLCKIVNPKQIKDTVANTAIDRFIYIPCGLGESNEYDYRLVFE